MRHVFETRYRVGIVAVVALAAIGVSACSSDNGDDDDAHAVSAEPSQSPTPDRYQTLSPSPADPMRPGSSELPDATRTDTEASTDDREAIAVATREPSGESVWVSVIIYDVFVDGADCDATLTARGEEFSASSVTVTNQTWTECNNLNFGPLPTGSGEWAMVLRVDSSGTETTTLYIDVEVSDHE